MKPQIPVLISCVFSLPLGYLIGKVISPARQVTVDQNDSMRSSASSRNSATANATSTPFEADLDSVPADFSLSKFPREPSRRLAALQSHDFNLPGYALTRLIPETIGNDNKISDSMAALMGLNDDERSKFDNLLTTAMTSLRRVEARTYEVSKDRLGHTYVSVPPFEQEGANLRKELLRGIEKEFGPSRRHLFEMQLLQAPTALGEFGKQAMVLRYPESIEQDNQTMVTVHMGTITDIGSKDERFQGREFQFTVDAFMERFSHLLDDR